MNGMILKAVVPLGCILLTAIVLVVIEALFKATWAQKGLVAFFANVHEALRWFLILILFATLSFVIRPLRDLVTTQFESIAPAGAASSAPAAPANGSISSSVGPNTPAPTPRPTKDSVDELKWMLTILAGFAVVVSVAQAAAAWVSALTYEKQATAKLQEMDKVLESVKAKYPIFFEIEEKRNHVHDALTSAIRNFYEVPDGSIDPIEALHWGSGEDFYSNLDVPTRILISSVESFASIDLYPARKGDEVENLKLFAVFYHAKFRHERKMQAAPQFTDIERAESYLRLALRRSSDFRLFNELGNVYLTILKTKVENSKEYLEFLAKAEAAFNASKSFRKDQQRAYYNLAYICMSHKGQYDVARDLLVEALKYKNWQKAKTPPLQSAYIHYNLACCLARILVGNKSKSRPIAMGDAEAVVSSLRAAQKIGTVRVEDVIVDFRDPVRGDFKHFYDSAEPELRRQLDILKEQMAV